MQKGKGEMQIKRRLIIERREGCKWRWKWWVGFKENAERRTKWVSEEQEEEKLSPRRDEGDEHGAQHRRERRKRTRRQRWRRVEVTEEGPLRSVCDGGNKEVDCEFLPSVWVLWPKKFCRNRWGRIVVKIRWGEQNSLAPA